MPHEPYKAGIPISVNCRPIADFCAEVWPGDLYHLATPIAKSRITQERIERSYHTRLVLTEAEASEWNERAAERARKLEEIEHRQALAQGLRLSTGSREWYRHEVFENFDWAEAVLVTTPAPGKVSIRIRMAPSPEGVPTRETRGLLAHCVTVHLARRAPLMHAQSVTVDPPTDSEGPYR